MLTCLSGTEAAEDSLDPQDVERAKTFWAQEDVDQIFSEVSEYLDHLRRVLKKKTATDKEYVQGLKLFEYLDFPNPTADQESSVFQVVIGSGELLPDPVSRHSPSPPPLTPPCRSSSAGREEPLPRLTSVQPEYQPHSCCKACLSSLPIMPLSTPLFWGQNPLRVPLLCGFKRLSGVPLGASEGKWAEFSDDPEEWEVIYKAPCGQSLCNHDDVMRFLLATESYDVMQVDFFTFNPSVRLDPPPSVGPRRPELDLSRGVEPTPVELCLGDDSVPPPDFRYRKERWPHGCFLTRDPNLFSTCCDCTDGCSDAERCACVALTRGGRHYSHHRLDEPVPSGVYECGPWCGCDRARCLNRLVQRGIRVRLQVFQTEGRGWGVRCRDDLDHGTFVCIYAGVIMKMVKCPTEPPPPKLTRAELPSDDDVEVITEWLAPPVLEERSGLLELTSPPLHVPVIQRSADSSAAIGAGARAPAQEKTVAMTTAAGEADGGMKSSLKRVVKVDDVNFLDASKEGNVSRFINHSCHPNLFVQNVFTDSQDPAFPVIAFFTSGVVKAGTELTWDYSADADGQQEVECLCGSDGCSGRFTVEENLCDKCEVEVKPQ